MSMHSTLNYVTVARVGDVPPGRVVRVARHAGERARERRERPPPAIDARHLARGDAHQRDQVVAVPGPVGVGPRQRQAAARERAQEALAPAAGSDAEPAEPVEASAASAPTTSAPSVAGAGG